MKIILVVAAVWAMPNPADDYLSIQHYYYSDLGACEAHVAHYERRLASGGRWAKQYRYFKARCIEPLHPKGTEP